MTGGAGPAGSGERRIWRLTLTNSHAAAFATSNPEIPSSWKGCGSQTSCHAPRLSCRNGESATSDVAQAVISEWGAVVRLSMARRTRWARRAKNTPDFWRQPVQLELAIASCRTSPDRSVLMLDGPGTVPISFGGWNERCESRIAATDAVRLNFPGGRPSRSGDRSQAARCHHTRRWDDYRSEHRPHSGRSARAYAG